MNYLTAGNSGCISFQYPVTKLLLFLLVTLLPFQELYSQNCTTLEKALFFKSIKFGGKVATEIYTACAGKSKVGDVYYFTYDSLSEPCKKKYSDLFDFSSFSFSHITVSTSHERIYAVDLWSALDSAEVPGTAVNYFPERFENIFGKAVSLYGNPSAIQDEKNADPNLNEYYGVTRRVAWECNEVRLLMDITYGCSTKVMNAITIHIISNRFELPEEVETLE